MVMEAKCCQHAIKLTEDSVAEIIIATLKPLLLALLPDKRKIFIKELVKIGPQYAELVDLL